MAPMSGFMWAGRLVPLSTAIVLSSCFHSATAVRGEENGLEVVGDSDWDLMVLNATRKDDVYGCCCTAAKACTIQVLTDNLCPSGLHFTSFHAKMPESCKSGELYGAAAAQVGINVTIRAYWMRHGYSCANVLQDEIGHSSNPLAIPHSLLFKYYADPSLTDIGAYRAIALGKYVRKAILGETGDKIPPVFSSNMVRAMETALFNFPDWVLRPVPYIAEVGGAAPLSSGGDNVPVDWEDQDEKMDREPMSPTLRAKITFDENEHDHPDRIKKKSDYEAFMSYFPELLHNLIQEGKAADTTVTKDGIIPVIIVSHSGYMKEHLKCGKVEGRKPNNNEVWVQDYQVNLGGWGVRMEMTNSCKRLFRDASFFPLPPITLCDVDVARCGVKNPKMKPTYWLSADALKCVGETRNIVERDLEQGVRYATPP